MTSMAVTVNEDASLGQKLDAAINGVFSRLSAVERTKVKFSVTVDLDGKMTLTMDGPDEIILKLKSMLEKEADGATTT